MNGSTTPHTQTPTAPSTDEVIGAYARLVEHVRAYESVVIAYSGGVDSTLVLKAAADALGDRAVAATGLSDTYADEEMADAKDFAAQIGARHLMVNTMELTDPRYADNTHQRCYFCKTELYTKLHETAAREGIKTVADGANADDVGDFRPGMRAAKERGVRSPLQELGINKAMVRAMSAWLGLPTWDKPAVACLSSRFAYGDPITVEKLKQVAAAETFLRGLGYRGFRVRHEGTTARLEFPPELLPEIICRAAEISSGVKAAGYAFVSVDLDGYRAGSLNEVLHARLKQGGLRSSGAL